ncbi:MAG: tetratricopeptide (TPR) repeat protein [Planctomycetota bacterium]|jgi:tetratricopeptide (TPR) repeat protein
MRSDRTGPSLSFDSHKPTSDDSSLSGLSVAITGKLASMSREEAAWKIQLAGGEYTERVDAGTHLLVIGQGGPPLGEDGQLTHKLERARTIGGPDDPPHIISEQDWLARLRDGDDNAQEDIRRLYTREQLCRILGVSSGRLRSWVRAGLIRPAKVLHRLALFEFGEVASARSIFTLSENGVSPNQIRQSLEQLATWMPHTRASLSQLEAIEGGQLRLRLDDELVAELNGQLLLEFDQPEEAPERPNPFAASQADAEQAPDPAQRFQEALDAEEQGEYQVALEAYGDALRLGGPLAEICFNLGNVLHALDRPDEAVSHYLRAIGTDPNYVEAWNNLGNALATSDRTREAIGAYQRALRIAPTYADAHFNLAESFSAAGDIGSARKHWRAYLAQDPTSSWAHEVRERLSDTEALTT